MWGGGVQYGSLLHDAYWQTPEGFLNAFVILSFDGGLNGDQHGKTSSTPVILLCGNWNTGSVKKAVVRARLLWVE
jgi:hypothetical protein